MLSSQLLPVYGGRRRKRAGFNHPPKPPGKSFYKHKHFARCRIGYNSRLPPFHFSGSLS